MDSYNHQPQSSPAFWSSRGPEPFSVDDPQRDEPEGPLKVFRVGEIGGDVGFSPEAEDANANPR